MRISQREARRLRKRVSELELAEDKRRRSWASEWPGGVEVASCKWNRDDVVPVAIRTARRLGHGVVALENNDGLVRFVALQLAKG
jgi:hypothetical protein